MTALPDLFALLSQYAESVAADIICERDEITLTVKADQIVDVMQHMRTAEGLQFEQLVDLAGVDYLEYGRDEWNTENATSEGYSRGYEANSFGRFKFDDVPHVSYEGKRFAVVYHLLSVTLNHRLRVKVYCENNNFPVLASVTEIWASADWYEREAFDLFGILFEGHPDLRRLLTDYGFIGHPMRKDFPLVGHVEMRFDPIEGRVIYEPVSIEPRILVPKVIREDSRYLDKKDTSEG